MTAQLIQFPRAKKRGPKVRTGPRAEVLAFPGMQTGELWKRWLWLKSHGADWSVEEVGDLNEVVPPALEKARGPSGWGKSWVRQRAAKSLSWRPACASVPPSRTGWKV